MVDYSDMNRNYKNGCRRFVEYWKKINENFTHLTISAKIQDDTYVLEYKYKDGVSDVDYMVLTRYSGDHGVGDAMYFPLISPDYNIDSVLATTAFDNECEDLFLLFKLLNNKKNYIICDTL